MEEIKEIVEVVEPVERKPKKLDVVLLTTEVKKINGVDHYFVVTKTGKLRGFLVPASDLVYDTGVTQKIEAERYTEVYDWNQEIEEMLPSLDDIRKNVLLSFWRAGAFSNTPEHTVKRKMLGSAYPYPIPFKES